MKFKMQIIIIIISFEKTNALLDFYIQFKNFKSFSCYNHRWLEAVPASQNGDNKSCSCSELIDEQTHFTFMKFVVKSLPILLMISSYDIFKLHFFPRKHLQKLLAVHQKVL